MSAAAQTNSAGASGGNDGWPKDLFPPVPKDPPPSSFNNNALKDHGIYITLQATMDGKNLKPTNVGKFKWSIYVHHTSAPNATGGGWEYWVFDSGSNVWKRREMHRHKIGITTTLNAVLRVADLIAPAPVIANAPLNPPAPIGPNTHNNVQTILAQFDATLNDPIHVPISTYKYVELACEVLRTASILHNPDWTSLKWEIMALGNGQLGPTDRNVQPRPVLNSQVCGMPPPWP